jgi:hypothetical protein
VLAALLHLLLLAMFSTAAYFRVAFNAAFAMSSSNQEKPTVAELLCHIKNESMDQPARLVLFPVSFARLIVNVKKQATFNTRQLFSEPPTRSADFHGTAW